MMLGLSLLWGCTTGTADRDHLEFPKPTDAQVTWQDCEVGIVYHLDMPMMDGEFAPNNTSRDRFDPKSYNPEKLDTDQWIKAAKDAGAEYAIVTATHFNGFLQWQSDLYPYGLKQAAWRNGKGDIVRDFVESCLKKQDTRVCSRRAGFFQQTSRDRNPSKTNCTRCIPPGAD